MNKELYEYAQKLCFKKLLKVEEAKNIKKYEEYSNYIDLV
jgi:hypothetical protein